MFAHSLLVVSLSALVAGPNEPRSDDWPRYLGPNGDGVAPWAEETFTWPEEGPTVLWRADLGPGYGGAAVADGEVYVFDHVKDERDVLRAFDLATGEERWSAGFAQKGRLNFDGSRTVPTVVGGRVYANSGFGRVVAFDRDERKIAWDVDLVEAHGGRQPMFGWSTHPVVYGETLIAATLNSDVGLIALDLDDGSLVWKSGHLGYSHSTPVVVDFQGEEQLLFNTCPDTASGQDRESPATLWSLDPSTGRTNWKHSLTLCRLPVPPPVVIDANRVFLTGGYRAGSVMLRFGEGDGDAPAVEEAWRSTRGAQTHAPIRFGDHLYVLVNENWTESRRRREEGGLACFDLDGKEVWRTGRDAYFGRGGIVRIADALLIQDGFDGRLTAVRATPEGYDELGSFATFGRRRNDGQMWAPPAVSGTKLLVRSQDELVCLELVP